MVQYEAHAEHLPEAVTAEALFSVNKSFQKSGKFENDPFDDRLRRIEVSSDFDVKELLFRNFAGILGKFHVFLPHNFGQLIGWEYNIE